MAQLRSEKLLAALSQPERRLVAKRVAAGRRTSLKVLFSLVCAAVDAGRELEKEEVFSAVFGRSYTDAEDYLLRNEFRLLVAKAQDVLAEQRHLRDLRDKPAVYDLALLRSLMEKRLWTEFRSACKKALERALRDCDHHSAARMNELYFSYLMQQEGHFELYAEARARLEEQQLNLKKVYREETAHNQSRRVVCEHVMRSANTEADVPATTVGPDTDLGAATTPLVRFFEAQAHAFGSVGEQSILHAHEAVGSLMELDSARFYNELVVALGNLGLAYYLSQRFAEARRWYQQAIEYGEKAGRPADISLVFNYVCALVKLGEYRAVLDIIEQHRTAIEAAPRVRFRFECFRSFSYIFLRDPDAAFESIPPAITQRPESEYHYFRFALLVIPYLRGDTEDALRETVNFAKYFHRSRGKIGTPNELALVTLFRRFFAAVQLPAGTRRTKALHNVQAMQQEFGEQYPGYVDFLPLLWLKAEIERQGSYAQSGNGRAIVPSAAVCEDALYGQRSAHPPDRAVVSPRALRETVAVSWFFPTLPGGRSTYHRRGRQWDGNRPMLPGPLFLRTEWLPSARTHRRE